MGARGPQAKQAKPGNLERLPAAPATLKAHGKKKWKQIGKQLIDLRLADDIDVHALEQLCMAYDRAHIAQQNLDRDGTTVQGEKGPYLNPEFSVLSNANNLIKHYIGILGLTKRTRVDLDEAKAEPERKVSSRKR